MFVSLAKSRRTWHYVSSYCHGSTKKTFGLFRAWTSHGIGGKIYQEEKGKYAMAKGSNFLQSFLNIVDKIIFKQLEDIPLSLTQIQYL